MEQILSLVYLVIGKVRKYNIILHQVTQKHYLIRQIYNTSLVFIDCLLFTIRFIQYILIFIWIRTTINK